MLYTPLTIKWGGGDPQRRCGLPVEPDEVRVVGVHVGELNLDNQFQL